MATPENTVHIISDGTPYGTEIAHNGVRVEGVTAVSIDIQRNDIVKVKLSVQIPVVNVFGVAEHVVFNCPICQASFTHKCGEKA